MSTNRAAIEIIENRITVLSVEDSIKNKQVIREFESLRESLLRLSNEEDEEEYEEFKIRDLELSEKKRVFNVIMCLLSNSDDHHQSLFTPDLLDNLQDVADPMLLLNENDLKFIHNSVDNLYVRPYYYAILDFCLEARDWLGRDHDDNHSDGDSITFLRDHFNRIMSVWTKQLELQEKERLACALSFIQSMERADSYEDSSNSDKDSSHSDKEKQEKSPILERDRKEEFCDSHGRQSYRKRLKTSDEEQEEKSFVPMTSKFEQFEV